MAFSAAELAAVDHYFVERSFKRRDFLLEASHVCRHLFFVAKGCVRHFHIKEDGAEATCDITLENQWATDFVSFADETPSRLSLQALEDTVVYSVEKARLLELYAARQGSSVCPVQGFPPIRDLRETDNRTYPATIHRHIGIACLAKARRTL